LWLWRRARLARDREGISSLGSPARAGHRMGHTLSLRSRKRVPATPTQNRPCLPPNSPILRELGLRVTPPFPLVTGGGMMAGAEGPWGQSLRYTMPALRGETHGTI